MSRHATLIAGDLEKLRDLIPEQSAIINEAVSALYRQAATIAIVRGAIREPKQEQTQ